MPAETAFNDLPQRDAARLLVKLRREVSRELKIELDLAAEDALQQLHRQALRCHSSTVKELLDKLEGNLPELPEAPARRAVSDDAQSEPPRAAHRRMYRGRVVEEPVARPDSPQQATAVTDDGALPPGAYYVTYRGQRIIRYH